MITNATMLMTAANHCAAPARHAPAIMILANEI